ncbi:MAG: hypothetical protein AABW83_01855 [Nanoarchaeota archaeon]
MLSREVMGGGAVVVGILLALTELMQWPGSLNYIWATLVLIWGILWLSKKK